MSPRIDKEVIKGFILEARGYLPQILEDIEVFRRDPKKMEVLREAHRFTHIIKGAASMLGLAALSHIAFRAEELLDEIAAGQRPMDTPVADLLSRTAVQMETYLDGVVSGTLREEVILEEVEARFRKFRGEPDPVPPPSTSGQQAPVEAISSEGSESVFAFLDALTQSREDPDEPLASDSGEPVSDASGRERRERNATEEEPIDDLDAAFALELEALESESLRPRESDQQPVQPELLESFKLEAQDHLAALARLLPGIEPGADYEQQVQEVRRCVHTLKGAAGVVGLKPITRLSHRVEDLLDALFEGRLAWSIEVQDVLFRSADALEDLVGGELEDTLVATERLEELDRQTRALLLPVTPEIAAEPDLPELPAAAEATSDAQGVEAETAPPAPATREPAQAGSVVRVSLDRLDRLMNLVGELVINRSTFEQHHSQLGQRLSDLHRSVERLRRLAARLETEYEAKAPVGGRFIRSRASLVLQAELVSPADAFEDFDELELDRYTEFHLLSRELTETTADINAVDNELRDLLGDFDAYLGRQERLTGEVQDKLMSLRMVPLASLTTRLHRAVRVTGQQRGKQVELVVEGENLELDKTMLEQLADPLLHLVRNAVDHGIEAPPVRETLGKPTKGKIRLRAYHSGTQVVLQIQDDGAGLDPEMLRRAAVQGGFVSEADAGQLDEADLHSLILMPGFTTAQQVSEISGRGVGMDIVRSAVHKLKGAFAISSQPGRGATFTIRLPLTLAVTRVLLVRAHGEVFALPLSTVRQIRRVEPQDIQTLGQDAVVRTEDKILPLLRLGNVLHLRNPPEDVGSRPPMVVLDAGEQRFGLLVDSLIENREVVVKSLGDHLRRISGVTGATLTGDGSVVLILNPADFLEGAKKQEPTHKALIHAPAVARKAWKILIVDDSLSVRRVLSNLVRQAGWEPLEAKDGLDALDVLHRSAVPPELVLLDIEMPRMDGYELVSSLRSQAAYRELPVVMLTSRAGSKHRDKALHLGASEYLVKPFQDEILLDTIRRLVQAGRRSSGP